MTCAKAFCTLYDVTVERPNHGCQVAAFHTSAAGVAVFSAHHGKDEKLRSELCTELNGDGDQTKKLADWCHKVWRLELIVGPLMLPDSHDISEVGTHKLVQAVTLLICIWGLLGSNLDRNTYPRGKCRYSTLNYAFIAFFHILSNSLFTFRSFYAI
jgi:hypothetical protein